MNNRQAVKAADSRRRTWQPDDPGVFDNPSNIEVKQLTPLYSVRWPEKKYEDDLGELTREFRVQVMWADHLEIITTPAGFVFGPSIPKPFRGFVSVADAFEGSCIHDWIYRNGLYTREFADLVFREMVRQAAGSWRARRAYLAVRVGGASSYKG